MTQRPPSLLYNGFQVSFPDVKWPRRGTDHPPPSRAKTENAWSPFVPSNGMFHCDLHIYLHLHRTNSDEVFWKTYGSNSADVTARRSCVMRLTNQLINITSKMKSRAKWRTVYGKLMKTVEHVPNCNTKHLKEGDHMLLGWRRKQSHYRPGQALRDPGGCGSVTSRQSVHEGGKVVSPTHRPRLFPTKNYGYSFLLHAESTPGPQCDRKDYVNEKFGNRTRDLTAVSAVPQSTALSRAPPEEETERISSFSTPEIRHGNRQAACNMLTDGRTYILCNT
jgi:hypothetical protein